MNASTRTSSIPAQPTGGISTGPTSGPAPLTVPFADCWMSEEARQRAMKVLASGWVTTGAETAAFETEFAEQVGAKHAVAVASCTAAIELALRSLKLPRGAVVLTSTMTFCGAVQAILHAELTPVLVDVDPRTGMPTPETVELAAHGREPAAMVVVHWSGDPADVTALADAAGLPLERVVEDAAHALGAERAGEPIGTGSAVCFSFYATKNLPLGEGGMITTDDGERAAWWRKARLHGMSADAWRRYLPGGGWRYDVAEAGLKANLSDLQAAIGRGQLAHLDEWQARRAEIAARYDAQLADVPGLVLPHRPEPAEGRHAWHLYAVRTVSPSVSRDLLVERLAARGIGSSVHFIPVHHLGYYARAAVMPEGGLRGADTMFQGLLSLPLYPRLADSQVDRVCEAMAGTLSTSWTELGR